MKHLLLIGSLLLAGACTSLTEKEEKEVMALAKENFEALPKSIVDQKKYAKRIALGKKLYMDTAMSINGTISCNSCHKLDTFGVDNEPTSPGHDGTRGGRNSPTVYNAALHFAQFWDGRAKDVEEQALGPLLNPIEHGMKSKKDVLKALKEKGYEKEFKEAFKKDRRPFSFRNIGRAIGAFERTLLTPSRFDDYLNGDKNALSAREKIGLKKFVNIGCTTCHSGVGVGGGMYQKLGLVEAYPTDDPGRFEVTKDEEDRHYFKVPGLRNITETGPYLHDGSIKSLGEMIRIMAKHQLGEKVTSEDVSDIKAFLGSLKGKNI